MSLLEMVPDTIGSGQLGMFLVSTESQVTAVDKQHHHRKIRCVFRVEEGISSLLPKNVEISGGLGIF